MKDFKNYYIIPASPQEVYEALTNPLSIRLWTGEPAEMSTVPGSEFSLWDGSIAGRNLEFEPGKKIVQEWYFGDLVPSSVVTIKLHEHKKGCSLELKHINIPDQDFEDIAEGWESDYMGNLIEFFSEELS